MKYYFAPMEGITLYPLRNIHREMFGENIDKYYTPFLTAHHNLHFKKREKRDALPENINTEAFSDYAHQIVPQIMANTAETFIWAAKEMTSLGYTEVNLNLGCPAATVTNSHKGSGLLTDLNYLEKFLDGIFEGKEKGLFPKDTDITIKTRLGFSSEDEAIELTKLYARFPIKEMTIHARVREDFYKGEPRLQAFDNAIKAYRENGGKADICYNGNIFGNIGVYEQLKELDSFSEIKALMLGRGLMENPALARELSGREKLSATELKTYLQKLYECYETYIPEDRNVIFKLLEHWAFLTYHFADSDKHIKAIRKSRSKGEYFAAVNNLFSSCKFIA